MAGAVAGAFNLVAPILDFPDKYENPIVKKALYIIFDIGLIVAVCLMGTAMINLGQPGVMDLMSIPMMAAGVGFGVAFLMQDILPKKAHRTAEQMMKVALPVLIVLSATALILAPGHSPAGGVPILGYKYSLTQSMMSRWFLIGLPLYGAAFFAAAKIPEAFEKQIPTFNNV